MWPVQMIHIREGARAMPRGKGWERVKVEWIRKEAERVWRTARDAGEKGEVSLSFGSCADGMEPTTDCLIVCYFSTPLPATLRTLLIPKYTPQHGSPRHS